MSPALAFRDVTFAYRDVPVIEALGLEIAPRTMTAVLGPNGTGKTTLVRLASGTVRPGSGKVLVFGEDVSSVPARARARVVAVVPQESSLTFEFSVREVVLMGRAPHLGLFGIETREDVEIVEDAMRRTHVEHLASRSYLALSGGERQRVILARALAQQPRLVLLDEPTAFLDLKHRLSIYDLFASLHRETGLTVVFMSHDINLAARHCDRLVLLGRDGVASDGTPEEVLRPDILRAVYEVEAEVGRDPVSGRPSVVPVSPVRP